MLFIIGQNPQEVASKAFISLYSSGSAMDPELLAEDCATILIKPEHKFKNWVTIKNNNFYCTEEYKKFSHMLIPI